jgi:putative oxidoreductase
MAISVFETGKAAYGLFVKATAALQPLFLLSVRMYWGWQFFQTGWGKLHHLDKVSQFFMSLGLPAPVFTAAMVGSLELVGGALLFIGLGARFPSLSLFCSMSVAYLTAERTALFSIFSDPGKFYGTDAYTFWFAALLVLLFGPGPFSLDALIAKLRRPAVDKKPAYSILSAS